ncbi:MAG: hypothetical protein R2682_00280 [Pyrinomonadaceae bacterium]
MGIITRQSIFRAVCIVVLFYGSVLGCTAVPGSDPIGNNTRTALTLGVISILLLAVILFGWFFRGRKGRWTWIVSGIILLLHPAWTMSSVGGDCGIARAEYSKWFTGALALFALYQCVRWAIERRTHNST